ncbi:MAG: hypothetical protein WBA57_21395 [Elainellaceae cyanobacterium]
MATLDTLKVHHLEHSGEFMIINASDFDSRIHQHYSSPKKKKSKSAEPPAEPPVDLPAGSSQSEQRIQREHELIELFDANPTSAWREIAALAEPHGVEKPESGWRDAIPLIAAAEHPDATD